MHVRLGVAAALITLMLSAGCGSDDDAPPSSSSNARGVDPSTLTGSCSLLVGPKDNFVADAMSLGDAGERAEDDDRVARAQNNLFKLVTSGATEIQDPAGQLVDYLDDPKAYQTKDGVGPIITEAVDAIETACAGQ